MANPSEQDLYDQGRAELLRIRPDLVALPGDIPDLIIAAAVAMAGVVVARTTQGISETFFDGNKGEPLKKLVRDHTGQEPIGQVSATGVVRFSHAAGPTGIISAGTRVATDPDENGDFVIGVTDLSLVFGGGDAQLEVAATAEKAGRAGNVQPAAFTRILDSLFDTTFVVTNVERFAGGAEAQTDDEIIAAARSFYQTLRRGTKAAIEFGAKQVPTIRLATAVESATGLGTVYVADSDGETNAELVNDAIIELENWRALGAVVQATGGTLFTQAITVALTVKAGVKVAALVENVRSAIVSAVNRLVHGETLYHDLIQSAARAVDPDGIVTVVVTNPPTAIVPTSNQVIRTSADIVTVGG